ncbi:hypothetical protein TSAR_015123 [Trichomalopsis sarcophagae]|uniref:DDE Tnp4 domain-containing protein n=1 Tax=Trichomalopsis sarcophagae TaxID=543379 RepID=A0A232EFS7_9HYME|nr:hypothetical protein TSAR_015123 [Trichomalopsis sarcophagae]
MTRNQFDRLLTLLRPYLVKISRRKLLEPELRLAAVLKYLVHGNSLCYPTSTYNMNLILLESIIDLWNTLTFSINIILKICENVTIQRWWTKTHLQNAARDEYGAFNTIFTNFKINDSEEFYKFVGMTRNQFDRLLTLVRPYQVKISSLNDAGIFQWSDLGLALENKEILLPEATNFPGTNILYPFYIIGDGTFALKKYLMKPYTRVKNLTAEEEVFNYRLSRATLTIERAFGIFSKKWKIIDNSLDMLLPHVDTIIMCLVCLHNVLITDELNMEDAEKRYNLDNYEIVNNEDEIEIYVGDDRDGPIHMRNRLKDFFMSEYVRVSWQQQRV